MLESAAEQAVPGVAVRGAVPEMLAGLSRWDAWQEVILLGHAELKGPGRLGDGLARRVEAGVRGGAGGPVAGTGCLYGG